jgi:hypothetical protein
VLLTITLTKTPATDLGFLLHKNPGGVHTRPLAFGPSHVFDPEETDERCTAALLLDIDPVGLVRGRRPGPSLDIACTGGIDRHFRVVVLRQAASALGGRLARGVGAESERCPRLWVEGRRRSRARRLVRSPHR